MRLKPCPAKFPGWNQTLLRGMKNSSDGDFFSRDPSGFQQIVDGLSAARQELEKLEQQWLELEMLREELGAQL